MGLLYFWYRFLKFKTFKFQKPILLVVFSTGVFFSYQNCAKVKFNTDRVAAQACDFFDNNDVCVVCPAGKIANPSSKTCDDPGPPGTCDYADFDQSDIRVSKTAVNGTEIDPNTLGLYDTGYFWLGFSELNLNYRWTVRKPNAAPVVTTGISAQINFNQPGIYEVDLEIKRGACNFYSSLMSRVITITSNDTCPDINTLAINGPTTGSPNQVLTYGIAIPSGCAHTTTWDMNFADPAANPPQTVNTQDNVSTSYSQTGSYTITANVALTGGSTRTLIYVVNITAPSCDLNAINISGPQTLNVGQSGNYTLPLSSACQAQGVTWTFADSTAPFSDNVGRTSYSRSHAWTNSGSYLVSAVLNYLNGATPATRTFTLPVQVSNVTCSCTLSDFSTLNITGPTALTAIQPSNYSIPTPACLGAATVSWNFSNGATATGASASTTFNSNGSYTVTANLNSPACGALTRTVNVSVSGIQCTPSSSDSAGCPMTPAGTANCSGSRTCAANGQYGSCSYSASNPNYIVSGSQCILNSCGCGTVVSGSGTSAICVNEAGTAVPPASATVGKDVFSIDSVTHKQVENLCQCGLSTPPVSSPAFTGIGIDNFKRNCYQRWTGQCDVTNKYFLTGSDCLKYDWVDTGSCSTTTCGTTGTKIYICRRYNVDGTVATVADTECASRLGAKPVVSCSGGTCPVVTNMSVAKSESFSNSCGTNFAFAVFTLSNAGAAPRGYQIVPSDSSVCSSIPAGSFVSLASNGWTQSGSDWKYTMMYDGLPTGTFKLCFLSTDGSQRTETSVTLSNSTGLPNRCVMCSGATPVVLGNSCVACTPGAQQVCNTSGLQTCDSSGNWGSCQMPVSCGPFQSGPKCEFHEICPGNREISSTIVMGSSSPFQVMNNVSATPGQVVTVNQSNVQMLSSGFTWLRWDNNVLQFQCQSSGGWTQISDGYCSVKKDLTSSDPRCACNNGATVESGCTQCPPGQVMADTGLGDDGNNRACVTPDTSTGG